MAVNTASIEVAIATIQSQISQLNQQIFAATGNPQLQQQLSEQLAGLAIQLTAQQSALAAANASAVVPTASAGQVVQDDGTAGIQNPATTPAVITTDAAGRIVSTPTNSQYVATDGGTAATLSLTTSQGTPASDTNSNAVATPTTSTGVGAGNADAAVPIKNSTVQEIDNVFGSAGPIVPQPNVLDQYASYTYQASFYLMKPESFQAMVNAKKFNPAGSQLLFH